MTSSATVLAEAGLLDWSTASVGFDREWMSAAEVETLAVNRVIDESDPAPEVLELTSSALSELDIRERLVALTEDSDIDETMAIRRWLYAALEVLDGADLDEAAVRARLEEIYAEFGYPEIIRYVVPYNIPPSNEYVPPLECFQNALIELRSELLEPMV